MAKLTAVDNTVEHRILVGAITNESFLAQVIPMVIGSRYAEKLFRSPAVSRVFHWCREYHGKYKKAPGKNIQSIYETEANRPRANEELMESIGELLERLSEAAEQEESVTNLDHLLDEAEQYLRGQAIDLARQELGSFRQAGQLDKAEELIAEYRRPARPVTEGINPLTEKDVIREAFELAPKSILPLPGVLNYFLSPHFIREGFVAFMGPEKRGKTFILTDLALRALRMRLNVAFFAVGDMSIRQMVRRIHIRLAGRSDSAWYCQAHHAPVMDCAWNQDGSCQRDERECDCDLGRVLGARDCTGKTAGDIIRAAPAGYMPCTACRRAEDSEWEGAMWWEEIPKVEPLTWRAGVRAAEAYQKQAKGRQLKLAAFPNDSVSIADLDRQLNMWGRYENFIPDIIAIDYADILAPIDGKRDYRHQQNQTWMAMRRMSEERHCLVTTATQSDAASYDVRLLTMANFSEDKRKFGHVTAMFGLNQTADEKRLGIHRMNTILVREGECDPHRCIHLLQDLRRGRFWIDAF